MPYEDLMKKYLSQGQPVKRATPAGSRSISTEDILSGNWKPSGGKSDQEPTSSQETKKPSTQTIRPVTAGSRSISVNDILSGSWTPNGGTKSEPDTEPSKIEYRSRKAVVDEIIGAQRKKRQGPDTMDKTSTGDEPFQLRMAKQSYAKKQQEKTEEVSSDPYEVFKAMVPANTKKEGLSSLADFKSEFQSKAQDVALQKMQEQTDFWNNAYSAYDTAKASGLGTEEWYAQAQSDVDKYRSALEEAKNRESEAQNYLGRDIFTPDATQEELDRLKAEAAGKYDEARKGTQAALSDLSEAEKRLQYAAYFRWDDVRNSEDFEQKAAEGRTEVEKQKAISAMSGPDVVLNDQLPTDDWTEDQEKLYGYLLIRDQETGGNNAAEYGRNINNQINREKKAAQLKKIQYGSDAATAGRYVLSRGAALLSGADYFGNLIDYASKGYTMEKPYLNPTEYNRAVDSEVTSRLNEASGTLPEDWAIIGGKGLGDLAGVGTSAIDSGLAVLVGGGAGSLAIMGTRAASGSYYDAKERGATEEQALAYGAAAGVAEALFEKVSIDNLLDADKALTRSLLQNILVQGGIEMSEEMMTSIANDITEVLILQENSEFESTIRTLMQSGMSYDQARQQAMTNAVNGVIFDGISGFLSGGLMQGVNQAVRLPGTAKSGEAIIEQGLARDLIEVGTRSSNAAVQELAADMASGKVETNQTNIGRLLGVMQALDQDLVDEVSGRAEMQRQGAEGQAAQTEEQKQADANRRAVTSNVIERDAAERERERVKERERRAQQSREEAAGEEIESASAELGEDAKAAQAIYRADQDPDEFARAMNAAINGYAAEGVQRSYLGKSDLTEYLTKEQRDIAWEIGHEKYLARQQKAAEQTRRGGEREVSEIREGTVSWDGATIEGRQYAAVDRKTLSKTERRQADASAMIAKAMGVDLVFFDADPQEAQGAYRAGGTIYLNVRAGKSSGETLIVSAFSHELTHFAEEYGGESYEGLRSYVMQTLANNDQTKFEQLVEAKRRSRGNISYEEALSEVVADGCEMMLRDTNAPAMLARENPTLLQKICDWLDGWVKKIKEAFTGVSARHEEARILMERAEELQRRWDKALAEAVQNRENARSENESTHSENESAHSENENARSENKTTAENGGRVQYSIARTSKMSLEEQLHELRKSQSEHKSNLKSSDALYFGATPKTLSECGLNSVPLVMTQSSYFKSRKSKHKISNRSMNSLLNNLQTPSFSFGDADTVGIIIDDIDNDGNPILVGIHKNIEMDGKQVNAIRSIYGIENLSFWIGNQLKAGKTLTVFDEEKTNNLFHSVNYTVMQGKAVRLGDNLSQDNSDVKTQKSERDNSVSDRELLREAAEREGASDELKKYSKKADNLEAYQKRLERQQKKLTAEGLGSEERAALEKRIEETEELIARTQDALTRMELRPSMQQEIQAARTRWWSENIPDAVQTAREIQKENRELREAVQYYREQAQHTAPENRGVDKADVRRFARSLLKEHGSSADVEQLSRQIQKLGEKLVQGTGADLDSRELNSIARGAARMIVDEVYTDINEEMADVLSGLSERVRGTRLQITDDLRADIPDFNAWRKARLGRMTLVNEGGTSIDELYQDLRYEYGEGYFPADVTAASDQLEQIDRALDSLKPNYQYAFTEMERDEAVRLVSQEIMDTVLSGEIREAETIADRNYRKMQERMLTAKEAQHKAERKAASAERRADNAEKTALRQAREEQKAITREKVKNLRQELNESREARQKRINIERQRAHLSRMLRENSAKNHVPEALRGLIGEFLLKLDTLGPFSAGTKTAARFQEEMKELTNALQSVTNSTDLDKVYGDLNLTEGLRAMLQNNIDMVKKAIDSTEQTVTRLATLPQLRALEESLNIISTCVKNMNEFLSDGEHRFHEKGQMAESLIRNLNNLKEKTLRVDGLDKVGDFFDYDNTTPYYYFKRLGPEGQEIFWRLEKGTGKVAELEERVVQDVQKIYKEHGVTGKDIKDWETQEKGIKLVPATEMQESTIKSGEMNPRAGEREVYLTNAQAMNIYLLNKREQGRSHLYGTGIKIEDHKTKGVFKRTQEGWYSLMPEDVAKITGMLTEQQIKTADALGKYLDDLGKELGNEISRKLFGISLYTEENYWPITTDSDSRGARAEGAEEANLYRVANPGFSKKTEHNAANAARIGSVFDVFAKHSSDLINYNAMALPLLDAKRFLDYQGEGTSVQQSVRRAFGGAAVSYYTQLLKDLNGGSETSKGVKFEKAVSKISSNVKVSLVAANVRVILQQPTSIARAALKINPKYIIAGMGTKGGLKKALQYSNLAKWKHNGHYDTNISRSIAEEIKGAQTAKSKVQDFALLGAEFGDSLTLGTLWNACEMETREKTGLSGQELIDATVRHYEDVLLSTQVIDGTLMRSQNMRSKSALVKEFTAFKAEPTLTYNIILDLKSEFDKEVRTNGVKAAANKMWKPVAKTVIVWAASNALLAVAQAVGDAGRDDDDYETWWQKFSQHWKEDFADDMNPLSLVPILDDLITMVLKKDKDLLVLQPVKEFREFKDALVEKVKLNNGTQDKATSATYYGKMTEWGLAYKGLKLISSMSGIPVASGEREVRAGYNTLRTIWNQCVGENSDKKLPAWRTYDPGPEKEVRNAYEHGYLDKEQAKALLVEEGVAKDETAAGKIIYKWSIGNAAAYKTVKEAAVKGDEKAYREAMKAMTNAGYTEADVQGEVKGAIKQQYQAPESGQELSKAYCIDYLQRFCGMSSEKATAQAQEWTCFKVTGFDFGKDGGGLKQYFLSGEISERRAIQLLMTYGGKTEEKAQKQVAGWQK